MRSGWFWGTPMWQEYLQEYAKTRPECLHEWKSSPLADDHDYIEWILRKTDDWKFEHHQSQVIDLRTHRLNDLRKGHRSDIKRAEALYEVWNAHGIGAFKEVHRKRFGVARNDETFAIQEKWIDNLTALCVAASEKGSGRYVAAALWIIYQGHAYYASGPSLVGDVQSLVIYTALEKLKTMGIVLAELGQIDGETEKEKKISSFKRGFGGEAKPFTIVRRTS